MKLTKAILIGLTTLTITACSQQQVEPAAASAAVTKDLSLVTDPHSHQCGTSASYISHSHKGDLSVTHTHPIDRTKCKK